MLDQHPGRGPRPDRGRRGPAQPVDIGRNDLLGSHRDLNAHNLMFSPSGLRLIDTDAAGLAWPRWERANFAVLWARRLPGDYDQAAVVAFLAGYLDDGGVVDVDDPSVLGAAPAALVPWVVQNIEMAIQIPSGNQDELAAALINALLFMPREVATRQAVLARCLARL